MSDGEDLKAKSKKGGGVQSWSEHELFVYLLSAIEYTGAKIDFANAPAPVGRNASGCAQKMAKVKKALQPEIDAIKNGVVIEGSSNTVAAPAKKGGGRKRKAKDDVDGTAENGGAKRRGRAKKKAESESEEERGVKDEPEEEAGMFDEV